MPDLNYENPALLDEMVNVTKYWVTTMHADGLRFDAIPYLVEDGNVLMHSRGTHDVLRRFGSAIRAAAPQSFTVGEESDMAALPSYYPDQLDSYFEFGVAAGTLESARTGNAAAFVREITRANALPEGRWAPFLTNHDQARVMTILKGDQPKARVAASAMLMLPGTPFVYYGEEIGMIGDKPDEQIRTPMQWSRQANGGFTTGTPWESLQSDWRSKNVAVEEVVPNSLLNQYRRLIHLRSAYASLSRGRMVIGSTNDPRTAAFIRREGEETLLVVVNFGDTALNSLTVSMSEVSAGLVEPIDGEPVACGPARIDAGNAFALTSIPAHGLCVYRVGGPS